jgi:RNA polymerase sigma factor (sigma-70 family)
LEKNSITLALDGHPGGSDLTLLREMAAGRVEALNFLYARYGSLLLVYLTARLHDRQWAEEVLQDVMLTAWNGAGNFQGRSSVKTWLFIIARNQAVNAYTRRKLEPEQLDPENPRLQGISPEQLLEQSLNDSALQQAIMQLPEEQRETLDLLFFQQLSQAEVAQVMQVAPGTIKSRLSRARANLRKFLKVREEFE